jgi:UDP-N-acetyl-D-glucosamine dehydrogenase
MVNKGINYIGDVISEDLMTIVKSGMLRATSNFSEVANADAVCIAVPTPLDEHQQPDISYVKASAESIVPYMHKDMLIVLESTTYPGTTEELLKPILEKSGLKCGVDFYLAFSPERVDPGNLIYKTKNTPKVVGGVTKKCTDIAALMYENILEAPVHKVSSPAIAEMEKILENTYRNINIGLVNELAILCEKMGINIWEVIDAAKSKPYGFQAFYPGPGLGGHCIPLDPYYLSWKAREFGFHTSMIESSMMINDRMPEYCAERSTKILNRFKKAVNGANILILGVAYKQDIEDYRESPAIEVINELEKLGALVDFYDPYVAEYKEHGKIKAGLNDLSSEMLKKADLVLITTAHTKVDYDFVQQNSKFIFDTKNAAKNVKNRDNIELL